MVVLAFRCLECRAYPTVIISGMNVITNPTLVPIPSTSKDVRLYRMVERLDNMHMSRLMEMGWYIISSWIDDVMRLDNDNPYVMNIWFRMGRRNERLIVCADIKVHKPDNVLLNIDADEPGSVVKMLPSDTSELWQVRLAAIAGFGPGSGGGCGLVKAAQTIPFSVLGLDIEMTTFARGGGFPLPHDDIISITISNGAWYDGMGEDVCYFIYTFGYHRQTIYEPGRRPVFIKVKSSTEACIKAYEILNLLSPDFVNVHNGFGFDIERIAVHCAEMPGITDTFENRRLGNSGTGMFWKLKNGISIIDSMYDIDKYLRRDWVSISLAKVAEVLDLPPKLDVDEMMVEPSDDYDVTQMLIYNARDSDLHAWTVKTMKTPERYCTLAGTARCSIWDPIAGNTGHMVWCVESSVAMSMNLWLDMSRTAGMDEKRFEGGFVLEPTPGCYKGVIVIDGNSLYGSIMSKLRVFIDRCASSSTAEGLSEKVGMDLTQKLLMMEIDDVVEYNGTILMRNENEFMCIVGKGPTILSTIVKTFIDERTEAKRRGDVPRAVSCKLLLTSMFGVLGSSHGILSSKTCAMIVTYLARYYLRTMVKAAELCGYEVIYGDTDSIFVRVGGETEEACMSAGMKVKMQIIKLTSGTVFAGVGADIKGNYKSIVISAKKKYEAVNWDGTLDTKGLAVVKKDSLPIVKYAMSMVLEILNNSDTREMKTESLVRLLGKLMTALQSGELDTKYYTSEVKISGQPNIVYWDENGIKRTILVGIGIKPSSVGKKWIAKRIISAIDSVLVPLGMNNVSELLFVYESRRRMIMNRSQDKCRKK